VASIACSAFKRPVEPDWECSYEYGEQGTTVDGVSTTGYPAPQVAEGGAETPFSKKCCRLRSNQWCVVATSENLGRRRCRHPKVP